MGSSGSLSELEESKVLSCSDLHSPVTVRTGTGQALSPPVPLLSNTFVCDCEAEGVLVPVGIPH